MDLISWILSQQHTDAHEEKPSPHEGHWVWDAEQIKTVIQEKVDDLGLAGEGALRLETAGNGTFDLDFGEYGTYIIRQDVSGGQSLHYQLTPPFEFVYHDWDPDVWDFSDPSSPPTLINNPPPSE